MRTKRIPIQDKSDPASASLSIIENIEFTPRRIYWISDFVEGTVRGKHAHKSLNQIMFMAKGQLTLEVFYGESREEILMRENDFAVLVPKGCWRVMKNADYESVLVVLADQNYAEDDYIRDWHEYIMWFNQFNGKE